MRRITLAALLVLCVAAPAGAQQVLSNTPVQWGSPAYSQLASLFGINLGAWPAGDGYALGFHAYTGARTGNPGTAAEGLYLYEYWFETGECGGDGLAVRELSVPFASLVPLDVDGDASPETSIHIPYSLGGCGPAAVAAQVTHDGQTLVLHYPSGVSGGIANVYVISDQPPVESLATIRGEGIGSGTFATWSSLPEPSSSTAGLAALLALAGLRNAGASGGRSRSCGRRLGPRGLDERIRA